MSDTPDAPESEVQQPPSLTAKEEKIADNVAASLRKDLQEFMSSMRVDLLNDVKELIAKTVVPTVGSPGAAAVQSSVPGMTPQSPVAPQPPPDYSKMNKEQIAAYKDAQFLELVKVFGPLLLQQQQNPVMQEILNKIMMDQIAGNINIQRALLNKMIGNVQGVQEAVSSQQYVHAVTGQPVMDAAQAAAQAAAQQRGVAPPNG